MLKNEIIRIVKTLSPAEKRQVKMHCKKQASDRAYFTLFDLTDDLSLHNIDRPDVFFHKAHPKTSFETTARYLLKIITDCLVALRCDKDPLFALIHNYMRSKVLFERSLIRGGFRELKRVQKQAAVSQNHALEFLSYREELNMLADMNFPETGDQQVIDMQVRGKNILKSMLQVHEHHSLFELLKMRLIRSGKTLSEDSRKDLNDLLLSELSLVIGKVTSSFESTKLHLLFQSFFFTSISDYKSALKTFADLNRLFESNMDNPALLPKDHLSSLDGILDNLRIIRAYDEMPFYIGKVAGLDPPEKPRGV
ncbi:MAG: hypothetical protein INR69_02900 [Mucilaginibacter polytrichastri]|nr:hypothetical protein [Mucilaginibacter polytrichastri]